MKLSTQTWVFQPRKFLAKETHLIAIIIFRLASFFKCAPFHLVSKSSLSVEMYPEGFWKMGAWHAVNALVYFNFVFLYGSFFWTLNSKGFCQDVAIHILYLVGVLFATSYYISLYRKPHECLRMLNQFLVLEDLLKEKGLGKMSWTWHPFAVLAVYYMTYMMAGIWIIVTGLFLWNPTGSVYIYGYLPEGWQGKWYVFALCVAYEMFTVGCWLLELLLFFCFWCADIFTLNMNLVQLGEQSSTTDQELEAYLHMQVFTVLFNDFNGSFFAVSFVFCLVFTPTLTAFVSLRALGLLNIFVYLLFPTVTVFCLMLICYFCPQHAKVRLNSVAVLQGLRRKILFLNWRNETRDLFQSPKVLQRSRRLEKRIKAFPPLRIQISYFGCFSLATTEGMIEQLFNNVLLLLSL